MRQNVFYNQSTVYYNVNGLYKQTLLCLLYFEDFLIEQSVHIMGRKYKNYIMKVRGDWILFHCLGQIWKFGPGHLGLFSIVYDRTAEPPKRTEPKQVSARFGSAR